MASLSVEIVTSDRIVYSESDVEMVIAPGAAGTLGVLPNHAPLVATLAAGELRVRKGGVDQSMVVFGGFIEVTPTRVIVLADSAERVEEIDIQRADAARRRAEETIAHGSGDEIDLTEAEAQLRRAQVRLRVSERRRSGRRTDLPQ